MSCKKWIFFFLLLGSYGIPANASANADSLITVAYNSTNGICKYSIEISKADLGIPDSINNFRFFWHFGDGHFVSITEQFPGSRINHSTSHQAHAGYMGNIYLEITTIYIDSDDKPEKFYSKEDAITVSSWSENKTIATEYNAPADLILNRNFVAGHPITLIVPYRNTCDHTTTSNEGNIILSYDSTQIDLEMDENSSNNLIHGMSISSLVITSESDNIKKVSIKLDPDIYTQYLYIPMLVDNTLEVEDTINLTLEYNFKFTCNNTIEVKNTINPGARVAVSHDPNMLDSPDQFYCSCTDVDSIRYVVKFQNIGAAPAEKVVVKDIIPDVYNIASVNVVYPLVEGMPPPRELDENSREITWTLEDLYLRGSEKLEGLGNPGVAEYQTIDSLVFYVKIFNCDSIKSCDAIVNQAEIIFDCNPAIYTNPYVIKFGRADTSFVECSCRTKFITWDMLNYDPKHPNSLVNRDSLLGTLLTSLENYLVQWYPTCWLSNPDDPRSEIVCPKKRSFYRTFPARDSLWETVIIETKIAPDCFKGIEYELVCINNRKVVRAWVMGNDKPLLWHDCQYSVTYEADVTELAGLDYFISAVDPTTNCSVATLIDIAHNPCPPVNSSAWLLPLLLIADLLLLSIVAYCIWLFWCFTKRLSF